MEEKCQFFAHKGPKILRGNCGQLQSNNLTECGINQPDKSIKPLCLPEEGAQSKSKSCMSIGFGVSEQKPAKSFVIELNQAQRSDVGISDCAISFHLAAPGRTDISIDWGEGRKIPNGSDSLMR